MSRLVIYEGEAQRAEHELARAVIGLGRHPQNDIVLDDRTLSRFHARIEKRDDRFVVIGLGQNGVHINGERIDGEALLSAGDRIDLGKYTAVFQTPKNGSKNGAKIKNGAPKKQAKAPIEDDDLELDVDLSDDPDDILDDFPLERNERPTKAANLDEFESPSSAVDYMPPQPTLVLMFNEMEVSRHPVKDDGLVIGRSKQCDIVISLLGLSRKHSRIEVGDEGITVEDLGSQNGTWVNNERIAGQHLLSHGDTLNFYDYSILFLEDGDVEVGFPGAQFSPTTKPRQPTVRAPLTDHAPPEDETALNRARPGKKNTDGLNLDDLGDGSYLGDEFEEGASKPRQNSLLDDDLLDDDPDVKQARRDANSAKPGIGTELIDGPEGLSRADLDEDLEADIAFSSSAQDDDFVNPTTTGNQAPRLSDRTSTGIDINGAFGAAWPSDDDLEDALMVLEAESVTLDVTMKDRPYAQIPMSQPVMRLGSDPRCEISMPKSSGLRPWHVTFSLVGKNVLITRSNRASHLEHNGQEADVCIAKSGDTVKLGRVAITLRMRR